MFFMAEISKSCFNALNNLVDSDGLRRRKTSRHWEILHGQAYFSLKKRVKLRVSSEELCGGEFPGSSFFLDGNCPGGSYPGKNCPHRITVRGDFTGHQSPDILPPSRLEDS